MTLDHEMQRALELDGEKLRQMPGEDHGPWFIEDEYPGQAPCPHCFESSGYVWEHGNDWSSGPYSVQTNIPCKHCNGTGTVDSPLVTPDDLDNLAAEEAPHRCKNNIAAPSTDLSAWVLEHAESPSSQPRYWAAGQIDPARSSSWTENHMAAIRFARSEDAQAVADRLMKKAGVPVRVCEHIWTA